MSERVEEVCRDVIDGLVELIYFVKSGAIRSVGPSTFGGYDYYSTCLTYITYITH